jgi:hypothetical protein
LLSLPRCCLFSRVTDLLMLVMVFENSNWLTAKIARS